MNSNVAPAVAPAIAPAVVAMPRPLRQEEEAPAPVTTLTLSALNGRQEKLEMRVAACGVIFFVVNSGLLFLIIANYLFVVGGFVFAHHHQLK